MTTNTEGTTPPGTSTEIAKRQPLAICFDTDSFYASLDPAVAAKAQERAVFIREKQKIVANNFIEIGKALISTKIELGHGNFQNWLKGEFLMSEQSARAYMQCAGFIQTRPDRKIPDDLPMRIILMLAAKNTPESARTEILDLTASGKHVTVEAAKSIIDQHKPKIEQPTPAPVASDPIEQPEQVSASAEPAPEATPKKAPAPAPAAKSSPAKPAKPETKKARKARERAEKEDQRKREEDESDALAMEVYSWIYETMPADLKARIEEMKNRDREKIRGEYRGEFFPFASFLGELEELLSYFLHPDQLKDAADAADASAADTDTEIVEPSADFSELDISGDDTTLN